MRYFLEGYLINKSLQLEPNHRISRKVPHAGCVALQPYREKEKEGHTCSNLSTTCPACPIELDVTQLCTFCIVSLTSKCQMCKSENTYQTISFSPYNYKDVRIPMVHFLQNSFYTLVPVQGKRCACNTIFLNALYMITH